MKCYITDSHRRFEERDVAEKRVLDAPEMRVLKVYPNVRCQSVIGIGAALTEASAYVYSQMPQGTKEQFMELCFGPCGNDYTLARTVIGSSDFGLGSRSYQSRKRSKPEQFDLSGDLAYELPLILDALKHQPDLEFVASPWSPPRWAKTNFAMKWGGHLRKGSREAWARIVARYLCEYRKLGVKIGRVTVQNEPMARQVWESCLFSAGEELEFARDHLRPALDEAGLDDVRILVWDHNKERMLERAAAIMSDKGAADAVGGVAFHWYSGDHFEALEAVRELIGPDRDLVFTEGCDSFTSGDVSKELAHAEHYAHEIIGDFLSGANGILDWNILLDAQGGPNHVANYCDAPLMYDAQSDHLNVRLPFAYIGHFSRFVRPGARRFLVSTHRPALEACGFVNTDGSHALVVLNRSGMSAPFTLDIAANVSREQDGFRVDGRPERRFCKVWELEAAPHSIMTLIWQ